MAILVSTSRQKTAVVQAGCSRESTTSETRIAVHLKAPCLLRREVAIADANVVSYAVGVKFRSLMVLMAAMRRSPLVPTLANRTGEHRDRADQNRDQSQAQSPDLGQ